MKNATTENFLRWLEVQDPMPRSFHLPKPDEAGCLAAVRLRHTHYPSNGKKLHAGRAVVKKCAHKGWLDVRREKPKHIKLTDAGRAVLDAILAAGWPIE